MIRRGKLAGCSMALQEKDLTVLRYMAWHCKVPTTREMEAQFAIDRSDQMIKDTWKHIESLENILMEEQYTRMYWDELLQEAVHDQRREAIFPAYDDGHDHRKALAKTIPATPRVSPRRSVSPRARSGGGDRGQVDLRADPPPPPPPPPPPLEPAPPVPSRSPVRPPPDTPMRMSPITLSPSVVGPVTPTTIRTAPAAILEPSPQASSDIKELRRWMEQQLKDQKQTMLQIKKMRFRTNQTDLVWKLKRDLYVKMELRRGVFLKNVYVRLQFLRKGKGWSWLSRSVNTSRRGP